MLYDYRKIHNDYRDSLKDDVYYRLCERRNTKTDVKKIAKCMFLHSDLTDTQALDKVIDLMCANNRLDLVLTDEEYNKALLYMNRK